MYCLRNSESLPKPRNITTCEGYVWSAYPFLSTLSPKKQHWELFRKPLGINNCCRSYGKYLNSGFDRKITQDNKCDSYRKVTPNGRKKRHHRTLLFLKDEDQKLLNGQRDEAPQKLAFGEKSEKTRVGSNCDPVAFSAREEYARNSKINNLTKTNEIIGGKIKPEADAVPETKENDRDQCPIGKKMLIFSDHGDSSFRRNKEKLKGNMSATRQIGTKSSTRRTGELNMWNLSCRRTSDTQRLISSQKDLHGTLHTENTIVKSRFKCKGEVSAHKNIKCATTVQDV